MQVSGTVLVLGCPGLLSLSLVEQLSRAQPGETIVLIASGGEAIHSFASERVRVLDGDASALDFGLSRMEYAELLESVQVIHQAAAFEDAFLRGKRAKSWPVDCMREALGFAREASCVRRMVLYSQLVVSGNHAGWFGEEDLSVGQAFDAPEHEAMAVAERMARDHFGSVPVVCLRSGFPVQLSAAGPLWGEIEGPLSLMASVLSNAGPYHLPASTRGQELVHLSPVSGLAAAGLALADINGALGVTVHWVEPEPPTLRQVLETVALASGRPAPVFGAGPGNWLALRGVGAQARVERQAVGRLRRGLRYGRANCERLLDARGLGCPSFFSYAEKLIAALVARRDSPALKLHEDPR